MKKCPKCNKFIAENLSECSECGYIFNENEEIATSELEEVIENEQLADTVEIKDEKSPEQKSRKWKIAVLGLGIIVGAFVILFATHVICLHKWKEATCIQPAICEICGKENGESLGHDWKEATCTEPKICNRCNAIEGEALGHIEEKEIVTVKGNINKAGTISKVCSVCGAEYSPRNVTVYPCVDGEHFNFTPEEFKIYINNSLKNGYSIGNGKQDNDLHMYGLYKNGEYQNNVVGIKTDEKGYARFIMITGDMATALTTFIAVKFDSSINDDEFIKNIYVNGIVENNGIQYGCLENDGEEIGIIKPLGVIIE